MSTNSVNKIQELVYELNAGSAMTKNAITVPPEMEMAEIREVLRKERISGMPVVKDDRVVGIISIEDFINWLADDGCECTVEEKMSKDIVFVHSDEPLVHVVSKLESHGYGRLPVLDRKSGKLAGIITKGDIIEKLLHKIEVDYQEEEIRHYRASHFFEDIIADSTRLSFLYKINSKSIAKGGIVASSLKKTLKRLGLHPELVRRTSIAMYEAEMNVIIYAKEGRVSVAVDQQKIYVEIEDEGPGIPDVEQALVPGYSTAPESVRELGFGAGMGLQNIEKSSDQFEISSMVGEGTLLKLSFAMERE